MPSTVRRMAVAHDEAVTRRAGPRCRRTGPSRSRSKTSTRWAPPRVRDDDVRLPRDDAGEDVAGHHAPVGSRRRRLRLVVLAPMRGRGPPSTSRASSGARQSVQAAGPAALASASVRARSRSSSSRLPSTAATTATRVWRVVGVAAGGQVDEGEVLAHERLHDGARSCVGQPHPREDRGRRSGRRSPSGRASRRPCRCRAAGRRAAAGRAGRRRGPGRSRATTVSMRCRSTVCRWTALRCGRLRTAAHSGIHRSTTPARSRPSHTVTSPGPAASRSPKRSRAPPAATASGSGGRPGARFCRVVGESGRCCRGGDQRRRAARAAGRRTGRPTPPRTASPSCSEQAVAERVSAAAGAGRPAGCGRAGTARRGVRCRPGRRRWCRAEVDTPVSRSSASAWPSRAAHASWSSRPSRSRPRPVTTCTASRTSSRRA